jgi:hypothetical protein
MDKEAFVNSFQVPDAWPSIVFALTDILPGSVSNWRGNPILLNPCLPEFPDSSSDLLQESFEEQDSRHIIDRYGCKNRSDIGESTCMIN